MITGPLETLKRARKLRSEMSLPEVKLWAELRMRPCGLKFRRQHPAGHYVLDFFCSSARLAIEVDGSAHDSALAATRDRRRSAWLRSRGISTIRIPARLILEDIEPVVRRIVDVCRERLATKSRVWSPPLHQPSAGPPPRAGEDL